MAQPRARGNRRVWLPAVAFGLASMAILTRLVFVQIIDHQLYAQKAENELRVDEDTFGLRGSILDRNGNVLAASLDTWDIYVSAQIWQNPAKAQAGAAEIGKALKMDPAKIQAMVLRNKFGDIIIKKDVPYETGSALIAKSVPGLVALPNLVRTNPEGDIGASLVGLIGEDNAGLAGLEATLNRELQGTPGKIIYERDTIGGVIPFGQYIVRKPTAGKDVILTIDRYLQRMAEQRLDAAIKEHHAVGGDIIMMDPDTGEIYALATSPRLKYSSLNLSDPGQGALLKNTAVTDLYEPGSVMKIVTAAAAIDAGVVTENTGYTDTGVVKIYDTEIKNWDNSVYGNQTMTGVLQNSINTGAIFMEQKLGKDRFMKYVDAFGFGKPTGIDLSGEAEGIFRRPGDDGWTPVDPATQSFGQAISVTPIQMLTAVAAVINGGNLVRPHVVKATVGADGKVQDVKTQVVGHPISEATSMTLRRMLRAVVDPPERGHPGKPRDYSAGGKSGTANVPISNGYNDTQIASFIGFAPADHPRLLVLVKLDRNTDGQTGTAAAAPVFAKIADDALHYLNVRPDAAQYAQAPR